MSDPEDAPRSTAVPRWLPNAISAFRVLLVPLWLWVAESLRQTALDGAPRAATTLVVILFVLGFSDVLDGWIARRFELTSRLGATLDAVADKLAQVAFVTYLAWRAPPGFWPLPLWFWAVIIGRDVVMAIGYLVLKARVGTFDVEHAIHGKAASVLLFLVVLGVCAQGPANALLGTTVLTTVVVVVSTLDYVRRGFVALREPADAD